jgi:hypothetical protein
MHARVIRCLGAALALAACDDASTTAPADDGTGPYAQVAGRWERVYDPRQYGGFPLPTQRLQLDSHGRFVIELTPGRTAPASDFQWMRRVEYGRLAPIDGRVGWRVDSVVTVTRDARGREGRDTIRGPVIYVEGHEFGASQLARNGDSLVIFGQTAWIGAPMNFEAFFRRLP